MEGVDFSVFEPSEINSPELLLPSSDNAKSQDSLFDEGMVSALMITRGDFEKVQN